MIGPIIGTVANIAGGLLGGSKASQAANQQATAFRDASTYARNQSAFQPFGITTGFGSSNFGIDPTTGRVTSAGYSLDPRLQAVQNQISGQFGNYNLNPDVSQFQTGANQAFGAGTNLFNLGSQYTNISPAEAQQQYITNTQALLAAGRERDRAATANQVFRTGRTGLATGGTTTGMLQSNPEYAALYNARAQQDLDITQRAQEQGRANQLFGANLYTTGAGLNRSGASMLESIPGYQTAAYNPLRAGLGLFSDVEKLGMQPYEMSLGLGKTIADAGARQGEFYLSGERAAAPSQLTYSSYSPFAQTLQGAGQQFSSMGGSGNTSNWFDNLIGNPSTAMRYNTNLGSQQTRMLAEQDRGLF
jgi:hypothetical protein